MTNWAAAVVSTAAAYPLDTSAYYHSLTTYVRFIWLLRDLTLTIGVSVCGCFSLDASHVMN